MKLRKYTNECILREARLYLTGMSIPSISKQLGIPTSTISWHLIYPLKRLSYSEWLKIRKALLPRAKNSSRATTESWEIIHFWTKYERTEQNYEPNTIKSKTL